MRDLVLLIVAAALYDALKPRVFPFIPRIWSWYLDYRASTNAQGIRNRIRELEKQKTYFNLVILHPEILVMQLILYGTIVIVVFMFSILFLTVRPNANSTSSQTLFNLPLFGNDAAGTTLMVCATLLIVVIALTIREYPSYSYHLNNPWPSLVACIWPTSQQLSIVVGVTSGSEKAA